MADEMPNPLSKSILLATVDGQAQESAISQELVEKIADRIYAMLLHEMRSERERGRYWIESNRGEN